MSVVTSNALDKLVARLSQPSTYAGFSGLALALGYSAPAFAAYATGAATLFSLVAVVLGEQTGDTVNVDADKVQVVGTVTKES